MFPQIKFFGARPIHVEHSTSSAEENIPSWISLLPTDLSKTVSRWLDSECRAIRWREEVYWRKISFNGSLELIRTKSVRLLRGATSQSYCSCRRPYCVFI